MSRLGLILRSLRWFWRTHLGVLAGAAVATATLVGALLVGDSVRASLARRASERAGAIDSALVAGDRFFGEGLAEAILEKSDGGAAAMLLRGTLATARGEKRLHDVQVLGVDAAFFGLGPEPTGIAAPAPGEAFANTELARRMGVEVGDELVLRVEKPSALPRDVALTPGEVGVALRVKLSAIVEAGDFADFDLFSGSTPGPNLFVARKELQEEAEVEARVNLLLGRGGSTADWDARLRSVWTPEEVQFGFETLKDGRVELSTERIFFEDPALEVLTRAAEPFPAVDFEGVFTYFVNELRIGERSTPYSMVSALGPLKSFGEERGDLGAEKRGLRLGAWATEDLSAQVGDELSLSYYVVDASRKLVEETSAFRIEELLSADDARYSDRTLMPAFPGLADADNCRDWEPGTPVDLDKIRDKDEEYWDDFKGTPKAFVSLDAARDIWSSRFGALTAVRFPAERREAVERALTDELDPASIGLSFRDVGGAARASANSATDFGGLFIGLSFFLIFAALLLTAQLFLFGVEQRSSEAGLFAALGFRASTIRRLFFLEAAVVAVLGGLIGVGLGVLYTRLVLRGLASVWSGAVASTQIAFHASPKTLVIGFLASVAVSLATVALALRRELRAPSHRLLEQAAGDERPLAAASGRARGLRLALAALFGLTAAALVVTVDPASGPSAAGAFFGAGALTLVAGLLLCREALRRAARTSDAPVRTLRGLGMLGATRRPGRSLATIALMAVGTFLVVAVGANRLGPIADVTNRASGTGGFGLYGRTSLPVVHDLNTEEGREAFALSEDALEGVSFVPLRVQQGDDASCLNLARSTTPRLVGVRSGDLAERGAFRFADSVEVRKGADSPWRVLDDPVTRDAEGRLVVPAVGDATSLTWQLRKSLGDTLEYTDERGRPFLVRIVGVLADTILQGDLVIAEERFQELYPSAGGHRRLLVDVPAGREEEVSAALSRGLEDVGLALESTAARLDRFHAVQNTYLAIFQVLGGLGLLLGTVGLGMVLLRTTLERRAELALAGALGFRAARVRRLVIIEYGFLLALGLGVGVVASLVAILPAMRAPASDLSLGNLAFWTVAVGLAGLFWIALATRVAVQRVPLAALAGD